MASDRLLVPVANPETAERLLDTAIDVAADRDLEILVVNVVVVPMQLALEGARESLDVEDEERVVREAVDAARRAGVPAIGRIRFGRDVAGGILDVAGEANVDAILLGWRGRPRRRDVVLGSIVDEVLSASPCDVLVERIDRDGAGISSVLVPIAGGPNTEFAAEIAGAVARAHDASVELLHVAPPDHDGSTIEAARAPFDRAAAALGDVASVERNVLAGDVVETIVDRSSEHDVTVVGAAEAGLLGRVLVGDVPEAIARGVDGAVVVAKRREKPSATLWRRIRDRFR